MCGKDGENVNRTVLYRGFSKRNLDGQFWHERNMKNVKVATRRNQKCFELMQNSYHCKGEALPIKYNNYSLKNMFGARSNQLSKC